MSGANASLTNRSRLVLLSFDLNLRIFLINSVEASAAGFVVVNIDSMSFSRKR